MTSNQSVHPHWCCPAMRKRRDPLAPLVRFCNFLLFPGRFGYEPTMPDPPSIGKRGLSDAYVYFQRSFLGSGPGSAYKERLYLRPIESRGLRGSFLALLRSRQQATTCSCQSRSIPLPKLVRASRSQWPPASPHQILLRLRVFSPPGFGTQESLFFVVSIFQTKQRDSSRIIFRLNELMHGVRI
jgi:hypothetical protein